MSANLYETAERGEYYHIHGSLEASTTLRMIGLESHRPDLESHQDIVNTIEPAVRKHTVEQLEAMNARHRQAGVKAFRHDEFLQTPHVSVLASPCLVLTCVAGADDGRRAERTGHCRPGRSRTWRRARPGCRCRAPATGGYCRASRSWTCAASLRARPSRGSWASTAQRCSR